MGVIRWKICFRYIVTAVISVNLLLLSACQKRNIVEDKFFGMHINHYTDFASTVTPNHNLGYGSIRFWDTHTNWRHLEPQKGSFNFKLLDKMVSKALDQKLEILMTLGQPPDWATSGKSISKNGLNYNATPPRDIKDWKRYIKTLGNRYKGKIKYYEIWNEPTDNNFYNGSIQELVSLTKAAYYILKEIDPNIKIISPSPTGINGAVFLEEFLKAGGKEFIDVVGIHLYVTPFAPEEMISLIKSYKSVMSRYGIKDIPLWNTEFTWLSYELDGERIEKKVMPEQLASSYLARALLINIAMGIDRCFFYGLDYQASTIRLIDSEDKRWILMPGVTYKNISMWMIGSRVIDFNIKNGVYSINIKNSMEKQGIILWTNRPKLTYTLSSKFDSNYESALGEHDKLINREVILTNVPILIYKK